MFDHYWRPPVRKLLFNLLKWTENTPSQNRVIRGGETKSWQREIQISTPLISIVSMAAFFLVLVLEIGLAWVKIAGLALFLIMIFVFLAMYLRQDAPEISGDSEAMMLLGLLMTSSVLLMQVFQPWPLAFPMAAPIILAGLLLSVRLAIMVAVILCMIFGVLNNFSLEYFFVHLAGSCAAVSFLGKIRNRADMTRLGVKIAFINVVAILIMHFFKLWSFKTLGVNVLLGGISGFASALIVLGVLPYLELFFYRTTNIKLLELADFTQPLLKRLMLEAPGTYHHSLIMASLAEQAAEAIGDNALLARVGAYYHDIGKLSNPDYFIENQQSKGNPHDPLTPAMSSLIVISHVKEGVALAQSHHLDRVITDFIQQHHGTSLIHYFYHRALEQNTEIKSDNFRYPGPRPRTKVAAILMLSDAVEAASRVLEDPTAGRIKDMVEKIINNKFIDGQFAECPITLRDLSTIAESMVVTLSGISHARIEYQEPNNQAAAAN